MENLTRIALSTREKSMVLHLGLIKNYNNRSYILSLACLARENDISRAFHFTLTKVTKMHILFFFFFLFLRNPTQLERGRIAIDNFCRVICKGAYRNFLNPSTKRRRKITSCPSKPMSYSVSQPTSMAEDQRPKVGSKGLNISN